MRRRTPMAVLVAGMILALATVFAPIAAAGGPPDQVEFDWTSDPYVVDVCPFPMTVVNHYVVKVTYLPTKDGGFLEEDRGVEQDTFTANDVTLTSDWYPYHVWGTYDADFNLTSMKAAGQIMLITLPDGTVFRSAGFFNWFEHPGVNYTLTPDHGLSGDVDAFCAAFDGA
jgi:hypothetical protein